MAVLHTDYSDGKAAAPSVNDQLILSYMEKGNKDYYDEEIAEERRFQIWMQLSSLRTGLLSWYDFTKDAHVLEIGAGFGALTGVLCDRCGHVTATEKIPHRANAIVSRWQEKDNLDVYVGEWTEMDFGQKFDYIILTGILERVCGGSKESREYAEYLQKVSSLLKEDGILLAAVENRLGLKYFCGAKEPHSGKVFDGINHYPNGTKGYSFSRQELTDIVKEAGYPALKFYYPLPDYKLPQLIYTDECLPEKNLRERLIPYDTSNGSLIAVEKNLYDDVIDNGVFPFFANSFLIECGRKENFSKAVYAAVSTDRGREQSFATVIYDNQIVEKRALFAQGQESIAGQCGNLKDLKERGIPVIEAERIENIISMPYIEYPTLSNVLKLLVQKDTGRFVEILDRLYGFILQSSPEVDQNDNRLAERLYEQAKSEEEREKIRALDWGPVLEKVYMELIPLNCFYDQEREQFLFFDQEFVREKYPAKYTLFRAIHYIYCFTPDAEKYISKKQICKKYGLENLWDYFLKEEWRFLDEVRNHAMYRQFYQWAKIEPGKVYQNADKLRSEEEVIAEYKVSDKMKKIWKVELAMLDEVERICRKYQLTYFLVHGSLLGALRHQGFIPWDDDLDIAMPRKDYDMFRQVADGELREPLSLHTPATEEDMFWGGFSRLRNGATTGIEVRFLERKGNLGIWIDIMPLDVCPMSEDKFDRKERRIRHCHRLIYAKLYGKEYKRYWDMKALQWKSYRLLAKMYSHKKLCSMLDAAMRMYEEEASDDVAFYTSYYGHRRLSAKDFANTAMVEFEHRKEPVPAGYENYLFMTLGKDYLRYPPKEERKPKHQGIFDPERSYQEYTEMLCGMFEGVKGKKIILFGSGKMFEDYMNKYGSRFRPSFLVDNDETKWGRKRMGIDIKRPEAILEVPQAKRRLIICSFYYREITQQLDKMGIHDYKIYIQKLEWVLKTEEQQK